MRLAKVSTQHFTGAVKCLCLALSLLILGYGVTAFGQTGASLPTTNVAKTGTASVLSAQPRPAIRSPVRVQTVGNYSLRFHGNGVNDIDRVKIAIDSPDRPVDVGGAFTLEFWMKASTQTTTTSCTIGNDSWINGNIVFDRDVFFAGDFGDYGISIMNGRLAFGVNNGTTGATACGGSSVVGNIWRHIAVTRNSVTGELRLFVDGQLDGSVMAPTGNLSYRNGRATSFPNSDPFLVIGAEKHDVGTAFPAYRGLLDEVRISNVVRYTTNFTRPASEFSTDPNTAALYHFNEGSGMTAVDSSGAPGGPSNGTVNVGGTPQGPEWSTDTPFPSGCTYSISPTSQSILARAGAASVNVTAPAGCGWTASSNAPWITITSGSSGTGDGTVGYSVAVNPGGSRTGTMTVAGFTFTVNQPRAWPWGRLFSPTR